MKRRVVVTGVGLVSPLGIGTEPTWDRILAGQSGIGPITRFDTEQFASRIAGEVRGFNPEDFIGRKDIKKMDLFIQYSLAATHFAMERSGLVITPETSARVGTYIGSGIGGLLTIEHQHKLLLDRGPARMTPFFIVGLIVNLASGWASIRYGAKGPSLAVATACATGCHTIGESYRIIQYGSADAMIAGGAEAVITPTAVGGFAAMRALSTRNDDPTGASRPFDATRDGFVMGEGAGTVVLESLDFARKRGAQPIAELVGYGTSGDAYHVSAPSKDGDGPVRAMKSTLEDAGIQPEEVDYINAHGTSTPAGDRMETEAIKRVFGERARSLPISSTKSMLGHLLGAAGGIESGLTAMSLQNGVIPPTINLRHPDPECDLDYVPNEARKQELRYALNNSFGFGGTNACLLFKKFED